MLVRQASTQRSAHLISLEGTEPQEGALDTSCELLRRVGLCSGRVGRTFLMYKFAFAVRLRLRPQDYVVGDWASSIRGGSRVASMIHSASVAVDRPEGRFLAEAALPSLMCGSHFGGKRTEVSGSSGCTQGRAIGGAWVGRGFGFGWTPR